MRRLLLASSFALAACAPAQMQNPQAPVSRMQMMATAPVPAGMRSFTSHRVPATRRSNREIAADFLDLTFQMESGRSIARMTRFEGPISVRLIPGASAQTRRDLQDLIGRLRREAQIDISLSDAPTARITVEAVPRATLRRAVPGAACFVVPSVAGWNQYMAMRRAGSLDWKTLERRDRASVFVPSDAAPQEIRDCLHEELAQALGPLNDLYRLPDSVFNDDNIHAVLTGFDMLILRTYYDRDLHNGMTRGEAAARLPGILARLNPAGAHNGGGSEGSTSRQWISSMQTALGGTASLSTRRAEADRALNLGRAMNWRGNRAGFAHYVYGRLNVRSHPDLALAAFQQADRHFSAQPGMELHRAFVAVQLASFALADGNSDAVLQLSERFIPVARTHENAALMATLMMFQAEALELSGRGVEAQAVRLDSMGWARYGFGSEANVQARLREIAQLSPLH